MLRGCAFFVPEAKASDWKEGRCFEPKGSLQLGGALRFTLFVQHHEWMLLKIGTC
jgi:hypothetical protein